MNAEAFARYEQARTAGDYRRAAGELTRVLEQADSGSAKDAGAALERLLLLFLDAQHYRRAGELLDRYQHHLAGQVSLLLRAAQVRVELDQLEQAAEAIDAALAAASDPDDRLRAAELLAEVGSFAQATALYRRRIDADAGDSAALAGLASLYLWRLEIGPARALAEKLLGSDPRSAPGQRILAAIAVLQGSYEEALGRLDLLLQQTAGDAEAHAWRAQALLCLGHNREAFGAASASVQHGHSFAALALQLLAGLGGRWRLRRHPRRFRRLRYGRGDWRTLWHDGVAAALRSLIDPGSGFVLQARQELAAELTAISPAAPAILAQRRAGSLAALLEEALIASGGNRSNPPTHIDSSGTLRRLPRSTSLRVASRRALELIKIASPEEALGAFAELIARHPDSSLPWVHRGELQLWLGRYPEARQDLDAALAVRRETRWAWYGLAYLELLGGNAQRALDVCAQGIRVMNKTEGPVAFACRGEAYRHLGELGRARQELQRSCEINPTRLSSWINLALVEGAAGEAGRQQQIYQDVVRRAPALLAAALAEVGPDLDPLLTHLLRMMRGNRSSSCITYFLNDDHLRHVPM